MNFFSPFRNIIFILIIFLLFFVGSVSAQIEITPSTQFDAMGSTPASGEEITCKVIILPGSSEVTDLQMKFNEADAFIDKNSFQQTISPAGSPANISFNGYELSCDKLAQGEQLIITFNAYPKSLQRPSINPVNILTTYNQLGQKLAATISLTTDMSKSAWKDLQSYKEKDNFGSTLLFGTAFIIAIAIIILLIWKIKSGEGSQEANQIRRQYAAFLGKISHKISEVEENPSEIIELKTMIGEEERKINKKTSQKSSTESSGTKPEKPQKKNGGDKF